MDHPLNYGLPDQSERNRFTLDIRNSFSVIAPAGVGKTHAIVERIVNILQDDVIRMISEPSLAVVTYTKKAAEEMQTRTRERLLNRATNSTEVIARFNQVFFGTIHSFCHDLLRQYGYLLGLPSTVDVIEDDALLWTQFLRSVDDFLSFLPEHSRRIFTRHLPLSSVIELGRILRPNVKIDISKAHECNPSSYFSPNHFEALLCFTPKSKIAEKGVKIAQEKLQQWLHLLDEDRFLPLPETERGGKAFIELWQKSFMPIYDWFGNCAFEVALHAALGFRRFRMRKGQLLYDDLVDLVLLLLTEAQSGAILRRRGFCIILDEAQDTDQRQFIALTELARQPSVKDIWINKEKCDDKSDPPQSGRFCMVGDPQQAIYSNRAGLTVYQKVHEALIASGAADSLTFSVTFRCDRKIVRTINSFFPNILNGTNPVTFQPLNTRQDADEGCVERVILEPSKAFLEQAASSEKQKSGQTPWLKEYADIFARWLKTQDVEKLQARDWSEVAILCPRREWLTLIAEAMKHQGLQAQLFSQKSILGDIPAYAWLTALITIMAEPHNAFEITGVLREIFGISDHDIAVFCEEKKRHPERFPPTAHALQIIYPITYRSALTDPVASTLNALSKIRQEATEMPLHEMAAFLVATTKLRERLDLLKCMDADNTAFDPYTEYVDTLIAQAAIAQEDGLSLKDWADNLKQDFNLTQSEGIRKKNHLQLLTCHKAKGLEWDTVLLPFFYREITVPHPSFPFLKKESGVAEGVVLNKAHFSQEHRDRDGLEQCFELDRLLYVAMTRARHKLVLIDDSAFAQSHSSQKKKENTFLSRARVEADAENHSHWQSLPSSLFSGSRIIAHKYPDSSLQNKQLLSVNHHERLFSSRNPSQTTLQQSIEEGLQRARTIPHRVIAGSLNQDRMRHANHSGYIGHHKDKGNHSLNNTDNPQLNLSKTGQFYGNWWHRMMEYCPWQKGQEAWATHFQLNLQTCPDDERGEKEIALFKESELASWLAHFGNNIHTEIPFLWNETKDEPVIFEGIADLIMYRVEHRQWVLIDWKTDAITTDKMDYLKMCYQSQLTVYRDTFALALQKPIHAFLFSTALGKLITI